MRDIIEVVSQNNLMKSERMVYPVPQSINGQQTMMKTGQKRSELRKYDSLGEISRFNH